MKNIKCSKKRLMLGIPEAHYIAETEQMQSCNEQHPASSTCATPYLLLEKLW